MTFLTDIIRDVAEEIGIRDLSEKQLQELQNEVLATIVQRVSWLKQEQVKKAIFPWIEKARPEPEPEVTKIAMETSW